MSSETYDVECTLWSVQKKVLFHAHNQWKIKPDEIDIICAEIPGSETDPEFFMNSYILLCTL